MDKTLSSNYKKSVFAHEVFHQFQYEGNGAISSFLKLTKQFIGNELSDPNSYDYGDIEKINSVDDIVAFEDQGQFIEDFTYLYLELQKLDIETDLYKNKSELLQSYGEVLSNSGLESDVINDALFSRIKEDSIDAGDNI